MAVDSCCAPARRASPKIPTGVSGPQKLQAGAKYQRRHGPVVRLPGGKFAMGSADVDANPLDGEGPIRDVRVQPFEIDAWAVTNAAFNGFVRETGYKTEAEDFGWSFVFASFLPSHIRARSARPPQTPWWCAVEGATWKTPEGLGSDLTGRENHPVTHVSWRDAEAFARWAGGRLPIEAEWEYAARGGLDQARYPWGDELMPKGEHRCNIWQGRFPVSNTGDDGYIGTAPVTAFEPNGFGLFNVAGNVWEMCADVWTMETTSDQKVMRGGSYLCHDSYCNRYRVAARTRNTVDSSSGNQGFRLVYDIEKG